MTQLAWAPAPDLVQMFFLFCARRSDANLIHTALICAYIDFGIYIWTYIQNYTHILLLMDRQGGWCLRRAEGLGHMFVSEGTGEGEELPPRRNTK